MPRPASVFVVLCIVNENADVHCDEAFDTAANLPVQLKQGNIAVMTKCGLA